MELLSPVGSIDGVKAAILNGADSIYLGLTKLGKNISLLCSSVPEVDLAAADKIQTTCQL